MAKLSDRVSLRNSGLCPRWFCFTFDNGLRRLVQNPDDLIRPYVREGSVVLDVGPGIGYFTIPLARRVGSTGKVIAADIQQSMLNGIKKRAIRAGLQDRIELYLSDSENIYCGEQVDFILAFWMVHEVTNQKEFFRQLHGALSKTGRFLLAEPKIHVSAKTFTQQVELAKQNGFVPVAYPPVSLSRAVLFATE